MNILRRLMGWIAGPPRKGVRRDPARIEEKPPAPPPPRLAERLPPPPVRRPWDDPR